jgi:hypothetical protein
MRVFIVFFLSFYCLFALEISKEKKFVKTKDPNIQKTTFGLVYESKSDTMIENIFSKAISIASKTDICKGGSYTIYPSYKHINNTREFENYRSNINFDCEFKDPKKYEKLIDKIKELDIKLVQNKILYDITNEQKEELYSQIEDEIFVYAKSYIDILNEKFENCKIKSIDIMPKQVNNIPYMALKAESTSNSIVTPPIKQEIEYSLTSKYVFECEN